MNSLKKSVLAIFGFVFAIGGAFASLYETTQTGWATQAGVGIQAFSATFCSVNGTGAICTVDQPGSAIDNKPMYLTRSGAEADSQNELLYKEVQ